MKIKKVFWIIVLLISAVSIIYVLFGGFGGGGLKKALIESLPAELTSCYYSSNRLENKPVLDVLEVKDFKIERQSTEGKRKSVDCTIELKGEYVERSLRVNLECKKYDGGKWYVEDYDYLQEPLTTPFFFPDEKQAIAEIQKKYGFENLSKVNENVVVDAGLVQYSFSSNDKYEYVSFENGTVDYRAELEVDNDYKDDMAYCWWDSSIENNITPTWNIKGKWALKHVDNDNNLYSADITIDSMEKTENARQYLDPFNQPETYVVGMVNYKSPSFSNSGDVVCLIRGNTPETVSCEISEKGKDESSFEIYLTSTFTDCRIMKYKTYGFTWSSEYVDCYDYSYDPA